MKNKRIFIIGGAGFIGSKLIERLYPDNFITVYSRDEFKHYSLKQHYPNVKFILGDVFNYERLLKASKSHDVMINCAAIKQIDAAQSNPEEAINTIIHGAFNSKKASIENGYESSVLISTDKACEPTLLYGSAKSCASDIYVYNNENIKTNFSVCRYGNIFGSHMSIWPAIQNAIASNKILTLYSEDMTRFNYLAQDAIELIIDSTKERDSVIIPKLKSFKVYDLFEIASKYLGLNYKLGNPRLGEKLHEVMFSAEESRRIRYDQENNYFHLGTQFTLQNQYHGVSYSSKDYVMSQEELNEFLLSNYIYER